MDNPTRMTEAEYHQHVADYDGICRECRAIRFGDTEGDAEDYPCDECEANAVIGIENALIEDLIEIDEGAPADRDGS